MHKQGVVHRDLKMENVMVDIEVNRRGEAELVCKITDFGLATVLKHNETSHDRLGTPMYMAPEIFNGKNYDEKVDTWALGVLAFILLSGGQFPFTGRTTNQLVNSIRRSSPDLSFMERYSEPGKLNDFIMKCLDPNPKTRFNAEQLLQHEWLST